MYRQQDGYQGPTGLSHVVLAYRAGVDDGQAGRKKEPPQWITAARGMGRTEGVLWERAYGNGWEQGRRKRQEKAFRVGAGVGRA